MMNNYIGKVDSEWVDPKVELPPDQRVYRVRLSGGEECHTGYSIEHGWNGACVVAWLRIGGPSTAIPREMVQAALIDIAATADGNAHTAMTYLHASRIVTEHTGVTSSDHLRDATKKVKP
jgi:hypothetical protein